MSSLEALAKRIEDKAKHYAGGIVDGMLHAAEMVRAWEPEKDAEGDGFTCDACGEVTETAQQLVGHHVAAHGLKPS